MIARALTHDPRVIFLDEPTVGLDPQARLSLWEILRELHGQGRTIVMSTHYMEEADQLCDRLAIIDEGKLLALDTPAALKAKAPGDTLVEVTSTAMPRWPPTQRARLRVCRTPRRADRCCASSASAAGS
jgi:ABC-2 type transport system ATP-binding protein